MIERLKEAAKAGDIDKLYALLQEDGVVLEKYDEKKFIDMPLHVAASFGSIDFALEILRLMPSFGRKLNAQGLSPLHLELRNGHTDTAERLAKYEPQLVRVHGREGITPLHYVAECNAFETLAEFLVASPESFGDLTIRGESAVHVAVRHGRVEALKVLVGWLRRTDNLEVLQWKDGDGDTVFHMATQADEPEILKHVIIPKAKTIINEKNSKGLTAMDIATQQRNERICKVLKSAGGIKGSETKPHKTWASFLTSKQSKISELFLGFNIYMEKGLSGDMRNALLVVAVLIATAAYQAILQPPSGLSSNHSGSSDNQLLFDPSGNYTIAGSVINATSFITTTANETNQDHISRIVGKNYFYGFIILNSVAFGTSVGMIFALLPVVVHNSLLYISLACLLSNYLILGSNFATTEKHSLMAVYSSLVSFFLFYIIGVVRQSGMLKKMYSSLRSESHVLHHREMAVSLLRLKYSKQAREY